MLLLGAAGGIGRAIGASHLAAGGRVAGVDLVAAGDTDRQACFVGDITDEAAIDEAVAAAIARFGRLDVLVHAAGVPGAGPLATLSLADWRRVMDVNLTSAFLAARAAYPHLKTSRGALVFIASTSGLDGGTTQTGPAYAASKAGMINLTRYLAKEWALDGIRVNAIAPGPVMTDLMRQAGEARQDAYTAAMLTGRLIEPEEIGEATRFLIGYSGRSITGAVLNVSGGLLLD